MGVGSWARFIIGIILSVEIIRVMLLGGEQSGLLIPLAVIYLALTVMWFVKKILMGV